MSVHVKTVQRVLFREPDGGRRGLFHVFLSVISVLAWVSLGIVRDGPRNMLFFGIGFAFYGFAEFLPPNRQRSAGVLRILGVGTFVVFLILLILVPESILG
jgi:hypothetical protein